MEKKTERPRRTILVTPEQSHHYQFLIGDLKLNCCGTEGKMKEMGIKNTMITTKSSLTNYNNPKRYGLEYYSFDKEGDSLVRVRSSTEVFLGYETLEKPIRVSHCLAPAAIFMNGVMGTSLEFSPVESLHRQGSLLKELVDKGELCEQRDDIDKEPYLLKLWAGKENGVYPLIVMQDKLTTLYHRDDLADWISEEEIRELIKRYGGRSRSY